MSGFSRRRSARSFLSAINEAENVIAQASAPLDKNNKFTEELINVRHLNEFTFKAPEDVNYMDVSPKQVVSVAAALIPFLEARGLRLRPNRRGDPRVPRRYRR